MLIRLTAERTEALESSTAAAAEAVADAVGLVGVGTKHRADEIDLRPLARKDAKDILYPAELEVGHVAQGRKMKALLAYSGKDGPAGAVRPGTAMAAAAAAHPRTGSRVGGGSSAAGDASGEEGSDADSDLESEASVSSSSSSSSSSMKSPFGKTLQGSGSSSRGKIKLSTVAGLAKLQSDKSMDEKMKKRKKAAENASAEQDAHPDTLASNMEQAHGGAGSGRVQFQLDGSFVDDQGWALQIADDHRVFDPHLQTMREWAAGLSRMMYSCDAHNPSSPSSASFPSSFSASTSSFSSLPSSKNISRRASSASSASRGSARPRTSKARRAAAAATPRAVVEFEDYGLAEAYKTKFKRILDGTGTVYWPSGNQAICVSATPAGPYVTAYADGTGGGDTLRFYATPLGHGAVYRDDGSTHLSYSPHGVALYGVNGSEEAAWQWGSAPFIMPIELEQGLSVLCGTAAGVELSMQRQAQVYKIVVMPPKLQQRKPKPAGLPPSQVEFRAKAVCKDVVDRMNVAIKEAYNALHTVWLHTAEIHELEASRPQSAARQKASSSPPPPTHPSSPASPASPSSPSAASPPSSLHDANGDGGGDVGAAGAAGSHHAVTGHTHGGGQGAARPARASTIAISNPNSRKMSFHGTSFMLNGSAKNPDHPQPAAFVAYSRELETSYHSGAFYARNVAASGQDRLTETLTAWSYSTGRGKDGDGGVPVMMSRPKSAYERKHAKALAEAKHRAVGKDLLAAPAMMPARFNPDKLILPSRVAPGNEDAKQQQRQRHDYSNSNGAPPRGGGGGSLGGSDASHGTTSHYNLAKLMTQSTRPKTSRPSTSRRSGRLSADGGRGSIDAAGMQRPRTAPSGFGRPSRGRNSSAVGGTGSKGSPKATACVTRMSNPRAGNPHLPCHCDPRQLPTLGDAAFDKFVKRAPKGALIAVLVTERGTATAATEKVLLNVYTSTAGKNIFPCTTFPDAEVIVVKAFANVKVKGKPGTTAGLLSTRHCAATGMILFYGGGSLVHAKRDTRPLRGSQDFQVLLKQARSNLVSGRGLPSDFQF